MIVPVRRSVGRDPTSWHPIASAVRTLRDLGMPSDGIDEITETDDPRLIHWRLELPAKGWRGWPAEQRATLAAIQAHLPRPSCRP